jgi:superfamily II DNA or RNA helicase
MAKTPHDFQAAAVKRARQKMRQGRVLVTSPPGSGKTVMIAEMARLNYPQHTHIIAQRREILRQTTAHLRDCGISADHIGTIYPDSPDMDLSRPVQIASAATLIRRELRPQTGLVLLDEAHHAVADGHLSILDAYPRVPVVGFTATPVRMDGRGLGDVFDHLIVAAKPSDLINRQLLAKPRTFSAPEEFLPDLRNIRRAMGDYVPSGLEDRMNREELVGSVVQHYLEKVEGRTALVFATSIAHSLHLARRFRAAGVAAQHLDSMMPAGERDALVAQLRSGALRVVTNVGILQEGFDLPRTYAVILARPTLSLALFLQQTGRALRRYGNRRPLILDHARNCTRFGMPEADREFHLTPTEVQDAGTAPAQVCPFCGAVIPAGCQVCPECDHAVRQPTLMPDENTRLLTEIEGREKEIIEDRIREFIATRGGGPEWVEWGEKVIEIYTGYNSAQH